MNRGLKVSDFSIKVAFSWRSVDRFGKFFGGLMTLEVYQISANVVHSKLRNATFEGQKMPTSIKRPDSD